MSVLEDNEAALYGAAFDQVIGDSFNYQAAGGSFEDKLGFIDYRDQSRSIDGGIVIEQNILIEASKTAIPVKPTAACRVTVPKRAGITYKPANVGTDSSGNSWVFELVAVHG